MSTNIFTVPDLAPGSLVSKPQIVAMVHDLDQPEGSESYKWPICQLTGSKVWNMEANGADITGSTDCIPILEQALLSGFKSVYFPSGLYKFGGPTSINVALSDDLHLFGDGKNSVILVPSTDPCLVGDGSGKRVQISDLTFRGSATIDLYTPQDTPTGETAILLDTVNQYTIRGCFFENLGGHGIWLRNNGLEEGFGNYVPVAMRGGTIQNCIFKNSHCGLFADSWSEYNTVSGCRFYENHFGYREKAAANNQLTSCVLAANWVALDMQGGGNSGHGIYANLTVNHNREPLRMNGLVSGQYFSNCTIYSDAGNITIKNCSYVEFIGGFISLTGGFEIELINNTDVVFSNVAELNNIATPFAVTGNAPTFLELGKAGNSLSLKNVDTGQRTSLSYSSGIMSVSSQKGFAVPVMLKADILAITTDRVAGQMIYCSDEPGLVIFNGKNWTLVQHFILL